MIKAVIFDMDGIILDSEPLWQEAEIEVFGKVGLHLTRQDCMKTMGMRTDEVVAFWYQKIPSPSKSAESIAQEIFNRVDQLIREKSTPLPGVLSALQFLTKKKIPIGLATSSPHLLINTVVDSFNIRSYFKVLASASDEPYGKPHPGVYISTAKLLDVHPEHCLAIEDSFNGLLAAKAAKMKTIAIPDSHFKNDLRFVIADLQLESLLELNESVFKKLKIEN